MVRAGVNSIVFSSSAIYGEPETMPISERTVLDPINPYGFTKFVCEHMMDDFDHAYGLDRPGCATSMPLAPIPGLRSARTTIRRPISFRWYSTRLPVESPMSRCLEQTIRRRMALPYVTTFMCLISPARMCWRFSICSTMATPSPSTSVPVAASRSVRWLMRCDALPDARSLPAKGLGGQGIRPLEILRASVRDQLQYR